MLDKIKIFIKFQYMKMLWKKKNSNNFTYPKHLCDISKIEIGDYTYGGIDAESYGCAKAFLKIGSFCSIAQNVRFILDGEHNYRYVSTYPYKVRFGGAKVEALCRGPITIGDDVWIGERAIILSGVTIGQGAVIGAGSIVRHNVPPYAIYVGNSVKKYRFSENIIAKLMEVNYKKLTKEHMIKLMDLLYTNPSLENVDKIVYEMNSYMKED